jgi:hypothetical protein
MFLGRVFACTLVVGCVAALGFASQQPAQAGPPPLSLFHGEYNGLTHHNSKATHESEAVKFTTVLGSNNHFTGVFGPFAVSGKLNPANHAITFSGQAGSVKLKEGKGQLSATGLYCVGSLKVSGSQSDIDGAYTFSVFAAVEIPPVDPAQSSFGDRSGGLTAQANINNLLSGYSGHAHHTIQSSAENEAIVFVVTLKKPNGNFKGSLGVVPITGHVDGNGHVTFKGGDSQGGDVRKIKNGSAQLSAQGNYLLGRFKITGTGIFAGEAGGYTFEAAATT